MLNPAAALCSLFTGHMIQTLLKIVRLLCITISVGRSRSVKNVADTKLFAARSLQKARILSFLLRGACKKQVPTFFKAHLHSNAQKASSKSG